MIEALIMIVIGIAVIYLVMTGKAEVIYKELMEFFNPKAEPQPETTDIPEPPKPVVEQTVSPFQISKAVYMVPNEPEMSIITSKPADTGEMQTTPLEPPITVNPKDPRIVEEIGKHVDPTQYLYYWTKRGY